MNEIRRALYILKQKYGFPIGVYYRNPDTVNLQTGVMSVIETAYQIKRAIVLPFSVFAKLFRHFGNAAFNYGGDLDVERRVFVIDRRDIPSVEFTNTEQWYIIYNHKRYSFEKMDNFEYKECYFITGRQVTGTQVIEQHNIQVHDWLYLANGFVYSEDIIDTFVLNDGVK